jgi:hypothetical protein
MKKALLLTAALIIGSVAFMPTQLRAQNFQGQTAVSGGVGYSIVGLLLTAIKEEANTSGDVRSSKTPVLWGAADYAVSDRFSVGACYTYQSITLKYNSYTTDQVDTAGNNIVVYGDFNDRLSRQSIGIRPMLHFGDNEKLDVYLGARFSYVFWQYRGNRTDPGISGITSSFGIPVKPQFILGTRYFFIPNLGINAEFAVGPTYFMSFGVCARFGG